MSTQEIWKDIPGYEGLYQVSNLGRIKSFRIWTGTMYVNKEHILIPQLGKRGYYCIGLSKNGKSKTTAIHRVVAKAFIPNAKNYKFVNHKDENKLNNNANNLEWCTKQYNTEYSLAIPITQYDINGNYIAKYKSSKEAYRILNINYSHINECCNGKRKSAGGFIWKFKEVL